ncbi:MAG TPA: substrate-binding domain-containing protein [Candidatus Eremiobacteraceae bacterium]|nr:substrate-binding domain-containing protein [Candidatus Eremiobacteraceae bacterium]
MRNFKFLVSLITNDNDYQLEQANSAQQSARKLSIDATIVYADNDAITQSTQILRAIQAPDKERAHAVVFEPVGGTALPQVAKAAMQAGVGWAVLNRDAPYVAEMRLTSKVPIFIVTHDQVEVGRIAARQCSALLPSGGSILYIQGPSQTGVAKERETGLRETIPANIHITVLRGQWTEESALRAVRSWLSLSTSRKAAIDLVVSQNDAMAIGARKAFQEIAEESERERWLAIPFLGCDGVPKTGQSWVRSGLLMATILTPPTAGQAIEMLVDAFENKRVLPERTFSSVSSIPPLKDLRPTKKL